jgi:hypothetical protein
MIDLPVPEALREADRILRRLARAEVSAPVLLHGEGGCTWPVLDKALALGLQTRIGLEDTLTGPDGRAAEGNAALVGIALRRPPTGEPDGDGPHGASTAPAPVEAGAGAVERVSAGTRPNPPPNGAPGAAGPKPGG